MPLRPFPYQLGLGTDIVHVNRMRAILQKDQGNPGYLNRFVKRLFTLREQKDFYSTWKDLTEAQFDAVSKHLAGRWAAKEAVIKAVSWRRLTFHDIVIQRSQHGGGIFAIISAKVSETWPTSSDSRTSLLEENATKHMGEDLTGDTDMRIRDKDSINRGTHEWEQDIVDEIDGQIAKISISHDGDYATAVCLAAEEPMTGDVGGESAAREPF